MKHTSILANFPWPAKLLGLLFIVGLAGCAETLDTHGTVLTPSALERLKVGESTKDDVRRLLGSPATTGTLNEDRWYYVNSVVGSRALQPHDLKSRRVLVLDFDPASGLLQSLNERTAADGRALEPNRAATNTAGQTMGFFEQMFGNLGIR